jgi:hypothetical protein
MFVNFACPWRLEPSPGNTFADLEALLIYARGRAAHTVPGSLANVLARLQATGLTHRAQLPSPLDLLDAYGGAVEGLLLTTAADATPADAFAWCLIINHPYGFPLARITVPASRAQTRWREQVDNIIAGVALSQWHDRPPHLASSIDNHHGAWRDPDAVHVLDIDATTAHDSRRPSSAAKRSAGRPHLRRGHWRRQPVGPDRQKTRWTWVRATTVNTAAAPANQVYTLRVAKA